MSDGMNDLTLSGMLRTQRQEYEARIRALGAENAALREQWDGLIAAIDKCVSDEELYEEILTEAGHDVKTMEGEA